jgi:hypothetical protein
VRFCSHPNLPGYYVLSKVTRNGKVIHIRIKHHPGEWLLLLLLLLLLLIVLSVCAVVVVVVDFCVSFKTIGGTFSIEGTDQEYPSLQSLIAQSQYLHLEPEKAANHSKFYYIFQQGQSHTVVQGYQNGINYDAYDQNMDLGLDDE